MNLSRSIGIDPPLVLAAADVERRLLQPVAEGVVELADVAGLLLEEAAVLEEEEEVVEIDAVDRHPHLGDVDRLDGDRVLPLAPEEHPLALEADRGVEVGQLDVLLELLLEDGLVGGGHPLADRERVGRPGSISPVIDSSLRSAANRTWTAGSIVTYFSATAAEMGEEKVTLIVDSRGPGSPRPCARRAWCSTRPRSPSTYSSPSGALPWAGVSEPAMVSRIFRSSFFFWTGSVR